MAKTAKPANTLWIGAFLTTSPTRWLADQTRAGRHPHSDHRWREGGSSKFRKVVRAELLGWTPPPPPLWGRAALCLRNDPALDPMLYDLNRTDGDPVGRGPGHVVGQVLEDVPALGDEPRLPRDNEPCGGGEGGGDIWVCGGQVLVVNTEKLFEKCALTMLSLGSCHPNCSGHNCHQNHPQFENKIDSWFKR